MKGQQFVIIAISWTSFLLSVEVYCEQFEVEKDVNIVLRPSKFNVVRFINESYIVECEAVGQNLTVHWINPQHQRIDHHRGRVHVEHSMGITSLIINPIAKEDNGIWYCRDKDELITTNFNMTVQLQISFIETPSIQNVKENETANIQCKVIGDPQPDVNWLFNGKQIDDKSKSYTKQADGLAITHATRHDKGEYTCKALQRTSNSVNYDEKTIFLNVQYGPERLWQSAADQYAYINGTVKLTCKADAEPQAEFTWLRQNVKIPINSEKYQITTDINESTLQFIIADENDFGDYYCEAKNALDEFRHSITVIEGAKPDPPPQFNLRGKSAYILDINIDEKPSNNVSDLMAVTDYRFELIPIDDFKMNGWTTARTIIKPRKSTYVIDALQPNTTYLVRVASVNRAGLSDWRGPVRLETDSQIKEVYNDRPSSATTIYPITFATLSTFYRFFIHLFLGYVN